jgi:hypothetical protein
MKSSRFARVLSAILIAISACVVLPLDAATPQLKLQRQNELFLARLQPGHDTLASAEKLFTGQLQKSPASTTENAKWTDACTGRTVTSSRLHSGNVRRLATGTLLADGPWHETRRHARARRGNLRAARLHRP